MVSYLQSALLQDVCIDSLQRNMLADLTTAEPLATSPPEPSGIDFPLSFLREGLSALSKGNAESLSLPQLTEKHLLFPYSLGQHRDRQEMATAMPYKKPLYITVVGL